MATVAFGLGIDKVDVTGIVATAVSFVSNEDLKKRLSLAHADGLTRCQILCLLRTLIQTILDSLANRVRKKVQRNRPRPNHRPENNRIRYSLEHYLQEIGRAGREDLMDNDDIKATIVTRDDDSLEVRTQVELLASFDTVISVLKKSRRNHEPTTTITSSESTASKKLVWAQTVLSC